MDVYAKFIGLWEQLNELCRKKSGYSAAADNLRSEMDAVWYRLTDGDRFAARARLTADNAHELMPHPRP